MNLNPFPAFEDTEKKPPGAPTYDLGQGVSIQVQEHRACLETRPQLKEAVQGQRGHVGFAPPLAAFLHLLLELDPPGTRVGRARDRAGVRIREQLFLGSFPSLESQD